MSRRRRRAMERRYRKHPTRVRPAMSLWLVILLLLAAIGVAVGRVLKIP